MKLKINAVAANEINRITSYISDTLHNPRAAERIKQKIFQKAFLLKRMPEIGKRFDDIKGEKYEHIRYIIVENYLVVYHLTDGTVTVIHIIDGRTDYMKYILPGLTEE